MEESRSILRTIYGLAARLYVRYVLSVVGAVAPSMISARRCARLIAAWQNGVCESFNGRFRDELLASERRRCVVEPADVLNPAGAENRVRAGHAARSYS
jgi:hypothetical protein